MLILGLILDWSRARLNKEQKQGRVEKILSDIYHIQKGRKYYSTFFNIGEGLRAYWHNMRCDIIYYLYKKEPRYVP